MKGDTTQMVIDIALIVAVIISLGTVIKKMELLPVKYLPVINVLLGVIAGIVYLDGAIKDTVLQGLIIGLTASGVFDLSKVTKKII
jgi:Phage holin family Hol44, in holin superfamily V